MWVPNSPDFIGKIKYLALLERYNLEIDTPHYKCSSQNVIEKEHLTMYWNKTILTEATEY